MPIIETEEMGGMPHIEGHRIAIHHIVKAWADEDNTIEEIAAKVYPQLSQSQVREALMYAFNHKDEFDELMDERDELKREIRRGGIASPVDLPETYRTDSDS